VVGALVGALVGASVGVSVGLAEGLAVGYGVGTAKHAVKPTFPSVHSDAGQSWHMWYVFLSWYLPDGQWKQLVCPVHGPYLPVSHSEQDEEGDWWYLPMSQLVHTADAAIENVPSAHVVHESALYVSEY
jgi:hypothetical protein